MNGEDLNKAGHVHLFYLYKLEIFEMALESWGICRPNIKVLIMTCWS